MASTDRAATIRAIFVAYMANDRKVVEDAVREAVREAVQDVVEGAVEQNGRAR